MTRLLLPLALFGTALLCALALRRRGVNVEVDIPPDEMQQAFLDSRNSATYLYNAKTGALSSYN